MSKDKLKSEIMGCLPSQYIKDSITAGRIANDILDVIKPYLKVEKNNFWCGCINYIEPIDLYGGSFKVCPNCNKRI